MSRIVLALLAACAALHHTPLRDDAHEKTALAQSAQVYWRAVRWADTDAAALFVEGADHRTAFRNWLAERAKTVRYDEVQVLSVELDPPSAAPPSDHPKVLRTGTVTVRTEGYTLPAQIVKTTEIRERWYRTADGWYIDWAPDNPTETRSEGPATGAR